MSQVPGTFFDAGHLPDACDPGSTSGREPWTPCKSPTVFSRRWAVIDVHDADKNERLYALRFGDDSVEDLVRLDPDSSDHKAAWGAFGPRGRGYYLRADDSSGIRHTRVVDFDSPHPKFIELRDTKTNQVMYPGPWIDDHRLLLTYDPTVSTAGKASCSLVDLNHPDRPTVLDTLDGLGQCTGIFGVSRSGRWIFAVADQSAGTRRLGFAEIGSSSIGEFQAIADFPVGFAPAYFAFSADEAWFVLLSVNLNNELQRHIIAASLASGPKQLSSYVPPTGDLLNYLDFAPSGPRYLVHATRIIGSTGTNPIVVSDLQANQTAEVTPTYFFAATRGMTASGQGIILDAWNDRAGSHGNSWVDLNDLIHVPAPRDLVGTTNMPSRGGTLTRDGRHFYSISGNVNDDFSTFTGPVDWERFDFGPGWLGPSHVQRLAERATVDAWSMSPDESAMVYRAAIASKSLAAADPFDRSRLLEELGTYWVLSNGSGKTQLGLAWTAYDSLSWTPDSRGLFRVGPQGAAPIVSDSHWSNGQGATYVAPGARYELHWLKLDGGVGRLVDLTPLFGTSLYLTSNPPVKADSWPSQ